MKGDNKNLVEQSSELRKLQEELKQSHKKSQGEFRTYLYVTSVPVFRSWIHKILKFLGLQDIEILSRNYLYGSSPDPSISKPQN
jgi:hypothetical protein